MLALIFLSESCTDIALQLCILLAMIKTIAVIIVASFRTKNWFPRIEFASLCYHAKRKRCWYIWDARWLSHQELVRISVATTLCPQGFHTGGSHSSSITNYSRNPFLALCLVFTTDHAI